MFSDMLILCDILQSEIRFNQNTIYQIILNNLPNFSVAFKEFLINYYIKQNQNYNSIYLNGTENELLKKFLNGLGSFDVEGEILNIKNQQTLIKVKKLEVEDKNKKVGTLGTKLGFLCAVLVFIILI